MICHFDSAASPDILDPFLLFLLAHIVSFLNTNFASQIPTMSLLRELTSLRQWSWNPSTLGPSQSLRTRQQTSSVDQASRALPVKKRKVRSKQSSGLKGSL